MKSTRSSTHDRLLLTTLVFGVAARVLYFLTPATLWMDEAMISLNIAGRSWMELLTPLDYAQVAPIPFLWAERLMIGLLGVSAPVLRVLPFLAGVMFLFVVWALARRRLGVVGQCTVLLLAATSQEMLLQSVTVKPYAIDALVGAGLVWLALDVLDEPDHAGRWWRLALAGLGGLLLSFPAVFMVAGAGGALVLHQGVSWQTIRRFAPIGALWASVFLIEHLWLYQRPGGGEEYLAVYWSAGLLQPGTPDLGARIVASLGELFAAVLALTAHPPLQYLGFFSRRLPEVLNAVAPVLALGATAVFGVGVYASRRWGRGTVGILMLPIVLLYLASVLGQYPIGSRLVLYASGPLLLGLGAGVEQLWGASSSVARLAFRSVCVGVAALSLVHSILQILAPRSEEAAPLVATLEREWRPGDVVYVFHRAIPTWAFYTTDWSDPDRARLARLADLASPGGLAELNGPSLGPREPDEGSDLRYAFKGGTELIGVQVGLLQTAPLDYRVHPRAIRPDPDSGWAENEAKRMGSGFDRTWVLLVHDDGSNSWYRLRKAIERIGGIRGFMEVRPAAMLVRYDFPALGKAATP